MMSCVEATATGPSSSARVVLAASASIPSTRGTANRANDVPARVSWIGRLILSKSTIPSSRSNFLMCVDAVG